MHEINRNEVWKGIGFALLAVLLWSANFIIARGLYQKITPITLAFCRWFLATLLLFPLVVKQVSNEWKIIKQHVVHLCLTALTGVSIFNTFIYIAGKYTTAINLALIGTTAAPLFVLLITGIFLKDRLSKNQIIGALLCLLGIVLLITKGNTQLNTFNFSVGDIWIVTAALSFAIYTILVRRKPKNISSNTYLFSIFSIGTLFLLPACIVERSATSVSIEWSASVILSIVYLAVCASILAFLFWNISIHKIGPARTALFGNLIPLFSTIEAVVLLGEHFSNLILMSMLLILTGLLLANFSLIRK
jgi:drug/metabolite transporter (DMT)-like permease